MIPIQIIILIVASIFITLIIIAFIIFSIILYKKYVYLWKVVRKMENDKYLWPINKKISLAISQHINPNGNTLLIGIGDCSVLDIIIKKINKESKIDIIDSNKYLLDLAKEKYGERCNYINDDFINHKFNICYENVISTLPHKEFVLGDIDIIFNKYFNVSCNNIIYFEGKVPHVKNSYVKMVINNKNKFNNNYKWNLTIKKNYKNIPPINLCILEKKQSKTDLTIKDS